MEVIRQQYGYKPDVTYDSIAYRDKDIYPINVCTNTDPKTAELLRSDNDSHILDYLTFSNYINNSATAILAFGNEEDFKSLQQKYSELKFRSLNSREEVNKIVDQHRF